MAITKPGPVARWFLRAPTYLYRARLGWVLGSGVVMITTTGRTTGSARRVVVEVVRRGRQPATSALPTLWVVASRGRRSEWHANAVAGGPVRVDWMTRRSPVTVHALDVQERYELLADTQRRRPRWVARLGSAVIGEDVTADSAGLRRLAAAVRSLRLDPAAEAPTDVGGRQ